MTTVIKLETNIEWIHLTGTDETLSPVTVPNSEWRNNDSLIETLAISQYVRYQANTVLSRYRYT